MSQKQQSNLQGNEKNVSSYKITQIKTKKNTLLR